MTKPNAAFCAETLAMGQEMQDLMSSAGMRCDLNKGGQ
jgi:hypothetical protein